jgi:hypothetical protein
MSRMALWRAKKRNADAGILTQICVWAPERVADLVRQICERVAEPTERGNSLRAVLAPQINRRRTTIAKWLGDNLRFELDNPTGHSWHMRPIGGRILGAHTKIELTPDQAEDLRAELTRSVDSAVATWIQANSLMNVDLFDDTGVMSGTDDTKSKDRPQTDEEFARHEATIAAAVMREGATHRGSRRRDENIFYFEGSFSYPSYCKIVHFRAKSRVKFAFVHVNNAGTTPSNMFDNLATAARLRFYPDVPPDRFDWYDVAITSLEKPFMGYFYRVKLEHKNGVYFNPSWSPVNWEDECDRTVKEKVQELTNVGRNKEAR